MRTAATSLSIAVLLTVAACGSGTGTTADTGAPNDASDDTTTTDASTSEAGGDAGGDAPAATGRVVINEVNAQGEDWIELYNVGPGTADLSMHYVADSNDDRTPRVNRGIQFPMGTTLAQGAFLFVKADVADADGGTQTDCAPGVAPCFHVDWGISASNGETVFLLSPTQTVLDRAEYAANAAPVERSLGRVPDGTGMFVVTTPTPGAMNRRP